MSSIGLAEELLPHRLDRRRVYSPWEQNRNRTALNGIVWHCPYGSDQQRCRSAGCVGGVQVPPRTPPDCTAPTSSSRTVTLGALATTTSRWSTGARQPRS